VIMSIFVEMGEEFFALRAMDALTVGTLAVLEGILSVDNALVLAILVRTLPKHQQRKALTYGIVGAFVFRFLALIFAAYLMRLQAFKLIGGGYLLYLAMKHMFFFYKEDAYQPRPRVISSFWKTVALVELTDVAFSIDSITTAVAMSDKLLVVWAGGVLGIISLRLVSGLFVRLLEKLPKLEDLAYQLIFFVGTKLSLEALHVEIEAWVFWLVMGVIAVLGAALVYRDYYQRTTETQFQNRLLRRVQQGEVPVEELLSLEAIPGEVVKYLYRANCLTIRTPTPDTTVGDGISGSG
jgi:YkoY family integral membrane protein